jgi:hypothetical protein
MKRKPDLIIYCILIFEFITNVFTSNKNTFLSKLLDSFGATLAVVSIVLILCLIIEGIIYLFSKKFSWFRYSKVAIILYVIFKILYFLSIAGILKNS